MRLVGTHFQRLSLFTIKLLLVAHARPRQTNPHFLIQEVECCRHVFSDSFSRKNLLVETPMPQVLFQNDWASGGPSAGEVGAPSAEAHTVGRPLVKLFRTWALCQLCAKMIVMPCWWSTCWIKKCGFGIAPPAWAFNLSTPFLWTWAPTLFLKLHTTPGRPVRSSLVLVPKMCAHSWPHVQPKKCSMPKGR